MSVPAWVGGNWRVEEPQTDFRVHVLMFRYMLSSFQDHCGLETSKHRSPRLSLVYCDQNDRKWSKFDLLFRNCSHRQDSENGYQWQWRCVPIWISPALVSRFLALEPTITDTNGAEPFFRLQNREDKKLSRQFVLWVLRTSLSYVETNGSISIPKAHIGTRTLRDFLAPGLEDSNNDLGDVEYKLDLSCDLTKALSQFYKTSMMPRPWTEDTIEFMFHKYDDGTTGIMHHFPMISAPADPDPPENDIPVLTSRFAAQSLESSKFPEIKALGVMLLQIWLLMPMAQLSMKYPEFFENGAVTRMGQLNLCHSLNTGLLAHLPAKLRPVCEVVERCFNDELFEQRRGDKGDSTTYVRTVIFKRLLPPLKKLKRA